MDHITYILPGALALALSPSDTDPAALMSGQGVTEISPSDFKSAASAVPPRGPAPSETSKSTPVTGVKASPPPNNSPTPTFQDVSDCTPDSPGALEMRLKSPSAPLLTGGGK